MELVDKAKRKEYKVETYSKYFRIMKEHLHRGQFGGAKEMFTTHMALSMALAITRRTLLKAGIDADGLRLAEAEMNNELYMLEKLKESGQADKLLELYKQEQKSTRKKKAKSKKKFRIRTF